MNPNISKINDQLAPLLSAIVNHPVYAEIQTLDDLRIFMEHHIYAVWDFMSLLKSLQNGLTCTRVPWFPVGNADTRYLINEIVAGEESDVDANGLRKSHFELYLEAMSQSGADVAPINAFLMALQKGETMASAYTMAHVPKDCQAFMDFTFGTIDSGKLHVQAAVFTFGREDLIPGMFVSLVQDLNQRFPDSLSTFKYYLDRHIEVDGDHHSHLALEMTAALCSEDPTAWDEALTASVEALERRKALWDGAHAQILARKAVAV